MLLRRSCRRFNSTSLNNAVDTLAEITTTNKWKYKLDDNVESDLQNEKIKTKRHPGIVPSAPINIPESFIKAAKIILEDDCYIPKKQLSGRSENFVKYLKAKKPPMEQDELQAHISNLKTKVIKGLQKSKKDLLSDEHVMKSQLTNLMKKTVYNWFPVKYDIAQSLCYLVGRSAAEYAVLIKILSEIKLRNPDWKPLTLFDFGSGVGTVTWAANTIWPKSFTEYFNVDSSASMNDLAELLLKGGRGEKEISLRGVYYRQFFPSKPVPYDLVVSAYTLMELPSLKSRLDAVRQLWSKTMRYLVIVEQGSYAGFKVINEVRDFILSLGNSHVFSPCAQDYPCPQFASNKELPCNFAVRYHDLPLNDISQNLRKEKFSYIVLKKGKRSENDSQWPRLINPTLIRHKHVICTLCTKEGKIEQSVFTASKYGKLAFRCAKASDWGDRLPMTVKDTPDDVIVDENVNLDKEITNK
ncbi:methyltransferase-like protein 17, mitochondrial [Harmonia axyridis]|uniref:methyltransferase-like protein 17, mitochondrial n=1 Tax=Harmonia axyridis TaxID=115357 RepID=UPI001E276CD1|nr:methyltransferase-like protein 17, mitochondrial [Harmonia axyridis]